MKKLGKQTYKLNNPVTILNTATIVGPKEKEGPLNKYFDKCISDEFWGEETWEKAESKIIKETAPAVKEDTTIAKDLVIQAGESIKFAINYEFVEIGEPQDYDQGRNYSATVQIGAYKIHNQ